MVLLPASIFSVLIIDAVRSERVRAEHERTQRQRHIVRLIESDLNNWLFSNHAEAGVSKSLLKFRIGADRIEFPEFRLSLPYRESPQRRPFDAMPSENQPTVQSITDYYY